MPALVTRGAPAGFDWLTVLALLVPIPFIVLANLGVRHEWARIVTLTLGGCAAGLMGVIAELLIVTGLVMRGNPAAVHVAQASVVLLGGSALMFAILPDEVRAWLARVLPLDPHSPVHYAALTLMIAVAAFQLWSQLSTDVLAASTALPAVTKLDLVAQEAPLLLAGLLGVGLFVRRRPAAVAARIGWLVPRWWQVAGALSAAGLFFLVGNLFDYLGHLYTPGLAHKVEVTNQHLMGGLGDPAGIATVALAAGICEEALFRGALQPRMGILWTALVFALIHSQYGLSFDTLAVFVLGSGLGLLRRFLNTTSSTVTHVTYNVLAGTGISGAAMAPAAIAEVVLVVVFGAGVFLQLQNWRNARGNALSGLGGN